VHLKLMHGTRRYKRSKQDGVINEYQQRSITISIIGICM